MLELEFLSENLDTFKFKGFDGDCMFEVDNLRVSKNTLDYDTVTLYIDGEVYDPYTKKLTNWAGTYGDSVTLFEFVLNAYLRDDNTDFQFNDDWKKFDTFKSMATVENGLVTLLPQYDGFDVIFYELDLATDEFKYYMQNDSFMLLDKNNSIVTDEEFFFTQAYDEDTAAILKGEKKALYTGENWDLYVAENKEYLLDT